MALLALATAQDLPEPDAEPTVKEIRPDDGRPEQAVDVGGERSQQGIKRRVEPTFPDAARRQGLSFGRCIADLEIDAAGTPSKPTFVDCPEPFQKATAEALRQWRWHTETTGDGVPRGGSTRVVIDYRDDSHTALLANPDPLETPMHEFGVIDDARPACVGHATIDAAGVVLDKSANRLPDCIFEPSETPSPSTKPLNVLASCTATFVTNRGYAVKLKYKDCPGSVRAAAGRNLRSWTWPWSPETPVAYEMTLTFLAD